MKRAFVLLILVIFMLGCARQAETPTVVIGGEEKEAAPVEQRDPTEIRPPSQPAQQLGPKIKCPSSCDDLNACTWEYCNEETEFECVYEKIWPCCGDRNCDGSEDTENCPQDCLYRVTEELEPRVYINQIQFDAPNDDDINLNGEWIIITNGLEEEVYMNGWYIKNEARENYTFIGYRLCAGCQVYVRSGEGDDHKSTIYMDRTTPFWANKREVASLYESGGKLMDEKREEGKYYD